MKTKLIEYIKPFFLNESTGHDWYHVERVHRLSMQIQKQEGGNRTIISAAALLHDISDHKFNGGDYRLGGKKAAEILKKFDFRTDEITQITEIVSGVSFKGNNVTPSPLSLEGKIVQDADRLDAIGAIGIARTFAYGGYSGQPIYDPTCHPKVHNTPEAYLKDKTHTINHFYEKLLLLKDRMHTETAKKIALERHKFMQQFLDQFYTEWGE